MKTAVRAFVLSLVATGAFASMHTNSGTISSMNATLISPPVPTCPPNDPNACHICDLGGCGR